MNKKDPTEVLNDHINNLIDYLKRNIKNIGMVHGLSDSQISDMERDFIARLAFAAIIGDDEKESEKPEKPEQILQDICNDHSTCIGCMFARDDLTCRLAHKPYRWEV